MATSLTPAKAGRHPLGLCVWGRGRLSHLPDRRQRALSACLGPNGTPWGASATAGAPDAGGKCPSRTTSVRTAFAPSELRLRPEGSGPSARSALRPTFTRTPGSALPLAAPRPALGEGVGISEPGWPGWGRLGAGGTCGWVGAGLWLVLCRSGLSVPRRPNPRFVCWSSDPQHPRA